jgi:hypothetical protein
MDEFKKHEIINYQGKNFIKIFVKVNDYNYSIVAPIADERGSEKHYINILTYRPVELYQFSIQNSIIGIELEDFVEEILFFSNYLNKNGYSHQSSIDSLVLICKKHIKEYGRIIDTDLFSYIDEFITLFSQIEIENGSQRQETELKIMWKGLASYTIESISENLYITEYGNNNSMTLKPYLKKFK